MRVLALALALLCGCGESPNGGAQSAAEEKTLDAELARDPAAFLAQCDQILNEQPNTPLAAAALLKRAQFYTNSDNPKRAAADLLRLFAEHPRVVEEAGLAETIPAALQQAGFYLEAGLISLAPDPRKAAAMVWNRIRTAGENPAATTALDRYLAHTPDLDALLNTSQNLHREPADFIARAACLACRRNNLQKATSLNTAFSEKIRAILAANKTELPELAWLEACAAAVTDETKKMREVRIFSEEDRAPDAAARETDSLSTAIHELEELRVALLQARAERALAKSPRAFVRATEQLIAFCLLIDNRLAAREACQKVIDSLPDSDFEAAYRMKLADMYREAWRTPTLAIREYRALRSRFPLSPVARDSRLRECMALRDIERYPEAFSLARQLFANGEPAPAARLLAAACAVDMHDAARAEEAVWGLVRAAPESAQAPQGLLWLANVKVKTQDYAGALKALRCLAKDYPNSGEAAKGRMLMGRLERSALNRPPEAAAGKVN